MRRRFPDSKTEVTNRPKGPLTKKELEEIRQAYHDGCAGEILIGLRGEERLLMMLLPTQDGGATGSQMIRAAGQLRAIGCDTCLRVRRAAGTN